MEKISTSRIESRLQSLLKNAPQSQSHGKSLLEAINQVTVNSEDIHSSTVQNEPVNPYQVTGLNDKLDQTKAINDSDDKVQQQSFTLSESSDKQQLGSPDSEAEAPQNNEWTSAKDSARACFYFVRAVEAEINSNREMNTDINDSEDSEGPDQEKVDMRLLFQLLNEVGFLGDDPRLINLTKRYEGILQWQEKQQLNLKQNNLNDSNDHTTQDQFQQSQSNFKYFFTLSQFTNAVCGSDLNSDSGADTSTLDLLIRALGRERLALPDFPTFSKTLSDLFEEIRVNIDYGSKATYIPQLANQNAAHWAVAICSIDGQRLHLGDTKVRFCLQSCSKPITYALILEGWGMERVHQHVGREPSGLIFNALALDKEGLPHNPLINSGAIMTAGLVLLKVLEKNDKEKHQALTNQQSSDNTIQNYDTKNSTDNISSLSGNSPELSLDSDNSKKVVTVQSTPEKVNNQDQLEHSNNYSNQSQNGIPKIMVEFIRSLEQRFGFDVPKLALASGLSTDIILEILNAEEDLNNANGNKTGNLQSETNNYSNQEQQNFNNQNQSFGNLSNLTNNSSDTSQSNVANLNQHQYNSSARNLTLNTQTPAGVSHKIFEPPRTVTTSPRIQTARVVDFELRGLEEGTERDNLDYSFNNRKKDLSSNSVTEDQSLNQYDNGNSSNRGSGNDNQLESSSVSENSNDRSMQSQSQCQDGLEPDSPYSIDKAKKAVDSALREVQELWERLSGWQGQANKDSNAQTQSKTTTTSSRGQISYDHQVFLSEARSADRNFALAYYMKESKAFPTIYNNATCGNDSLINEVLMFYFQCCAIMVDSDTLSVAAATLANGGLNPLVNPNDPTNTKPQRVLKRNTVKRVLSLMYSCGMYDYSGEFAFRVGLPAKSGVAGGIMVVIPGIMGLATFSPKLDQYGNSARGKEFLLKLTNIYRFHNFDILPHTDSENMGSWNNNVQIQSGSTSMGNTQQQQSTAVTGQTQVTSESTKNQSGPDNGNTSLFPNKKKSELSPRTTTTTQAQSILANATMSKQIANNINNYTDLSHRIHLIHLASLGDAVSLRRLRLSGIEDFHVTDTDLRTPLHLASVNGHVNVVKFLLVQQHPVNVLDRWNVTPLDEAKREGHKSVIQLLKAAGGVEEYYEYINSSSGLLGLGDSSGGVSITIGPGGNISGPSSENLTGIMSTKSVSINVQSPKFNSKNTNKSGIRKKKNLINGDLDVTEVIRGAKSENLGAGNYKSFRNINMTNR